MPTVDELLNSLLETGAEHIHPVSDNDTYYIINPNTRQITNESGTENVIMQYDHNSERVTFEIPRYVDGHDMTLCNVVKVHYVNPGMGFGTDYFGVYDVDDIRVDPDNTNNVICTWLISRNVTQQPGLLNFLVQYSCVDNDGTEVYEWHTDIYSGIRINPGRDNGEAIVEEYADILEQWRAKLFGAEDTITANLAETTQDHLDSIAAKTTEALNSIPEDYTTTHAMADEALRTKADAVILHETGEHIFIDDSSGSNLVGLNLYGRTTQAKSNGYQLFDANDIETRSAGGATLTNNGDGTFSIYGSGNLTSDFSIYHYYTHEETVKLFKPGTLQLVDNPNTNPRMYIHSQRNGGNLASLSMVNTKTFEITQEMLDDATFRIVVGYYGGVNNKIVGGISKPMVYQDGDGTWEPFTGGHASPSIDWGMPLVSVEDPTVAIHGKNLITYNSTGKTTAGITYVVNNDGSVTINGTSTSNAYFIFDDLNPITCKGVPLTASINIDRSDIYMVVGYIRADGSILNSLAAVTSTNEVEFTYPDEAVSTRIFLGVDTGATCYNVTIHPMVKIKEANLTHDVPKPKQTIELTRTLRAVPVSQNGNYVDSNGQHWIADEIDFERGKLIQRVAYKVFDGTETTWRKYGDKNSYMVDWPGVTGSWMDNNVMCSHFKVDAVEAYKGIDGYVGVDSKGLCYFGMDLNTADDVKAWFMSNNTTVICPLIVPVEIDLTETEIQAFLALRSNATNTTVFNDYNSMMTAKYIADIRTWFMKTIDYSVKKIQLVMPQSAWIESADETYYYQALDYSAKKNSKIDMQPSPQQLVKLLSIGVSIFLGNENGVVTAYAIGGKPDYDLTVEATEQAVVYG